MPQINLSEIGERIQEAADESRIPEEVRERIDEAAELLAEAGKDISGAASRIGAEVSERLADVHWPTLALPAALAGLADVKPPKVDVSVDTRDLRRAVEKLDLPEVTIGRRRSGPPVVPLVLLAAVGGLFIGWWLATSTYTSARVKAAVQQVRSRMGMGNDWDEHVEDKTEDFWSTERSWETNRNAGSAALGGEAQTGGTWTGPSGSISGEDGGLVGSSSGSASSGSSEDDMSRTTSGSYPGYGSGSSSASATGATGSTGGTGYDPDINR